MPQSEQVNTRGVEGHAGSYVGSRVEQRGCFPDRHSRHSQALRGSNIQPHNDCCSLLPAPVPSTQALQAIVQQQATPQRQQLQLRPMQQGYVQCGSARMKPPHACTLSPAGRFCGGCGWDASLAHIMPYQAFSKAVCPRATRAVGKPTCSRSCCDSVWLSHACWASRTFATADTFSGPAPAVSLMSGQFPPQADNMSEAVWANWYGHVTSDL